MELGNVKRCRGFASLISFVYLHCSGVHLPSFSHIKVQILIPCHPTGSAHHEFGFYRCTTPLFDGFIRGKSTGP